MQLTDEVISFLLDNKLPKIEKVFHCALKNEKHILAIFPDPWFKDICQENKLLEIIPTATSQEWLMKTSIILAMDIRRQMNEKVRKELVFC